MFSLASLARFAPTVLGKVADYFIPGAGKVVEKIQDWYGKNREKAEKKEIIKALGITEEKLNAFDRMFIVLGRECQQLLDRVAALEAQGKDATDDILRAILACPELQAQFDAIGSDLAKLDARVSGLEAEVQRLNDRYASVAAYAEELKAKQLTDEELADFREFRRAKQFQAAGRIAESEPILLKLANTQPRSAAVAVAQAVARHGDPVGFEQSIRRAVKLRPDDDGLKQMAVAATRAVTGAQTPAGKKAASPPAGPQVGDTLDGWALDAKLGGGGWGIVFRAVKKGRTVALKVMRPELTRETDFVDAFREEVKNLKRLHHPNCVAIEENWFCTAHQCHYFVMPLLGGMNLERHLEAHGKPSPDAAMGWLRGLLDGLEHAHAAGLVHRDVKPQNVMIVDGKPVLIDFGIAGLAEDGVLGKSSFFAPPEMHGLGEADARADLFMLAATIFYALRSDLPLRDRSWHKFAPDRVPDVFRAALAKALSADPEQRPANATEMRKLLGPASSPRPDRTDSIPPVTPAVPYSEFRVRPLNESVTISPEHQDADSDPVRSLGSPRSAWATVARDEQGNSIAGNGHKRIRKAGERIELPLPGGASMALAWCPPGSFVMGSPPAEARRESEERQHEVRITGGFWIGVHTVTQEQWNYVMETPALGVTWAGERPIDNVRWQDAVGFCDRVNSLTAFGSGQLPAFTGMRLPTEAEWEYAARGGTTTPFYWGSELNGTQARCNGEHPYGTAKKGPSANETATVGKYSELFPHPWGLTDVHGNVMEWCADWYDEDFYARSPKEDPRCDDGPRTERVLRGGSWASLPQHCRAAYRFHLEPDARQTNVGFRVVLSEGD